MRHTYQSPRTIIHSVGPKAKEERCSIKGFEGDDDELFRGKFDKKTVEKKIDCRDDGYQPTGLTFKHLLVILALGAMIIPPYVKDLKWRKKTPTQGQTLVEGNGNIVVTITTDEILVPTKYDKEGNIIERTVVKPKKP